MSTEHEQASAPSAPLQDARVGDALLEVEGELSRALAKFASFNSPHEGKAVIEEELDELWEHVKANTGRSPDAREEAIQVAAMALRYAIDLCVEERDYTMRADAHGWLELAAASETRLNAKEQHV